MVEYNDVVAIEFILTLVDRVDVLHVNGISGGAGEAQDHDYDRSGGLSLLLWIESFEIEVHGSAIFQQEPLPVIKEVLGARAPKFLFD